MDRVHEGVKHFRERVFPTHRELFEDLADGQNPAVLFITCADSRVDPSLITSSPPGTLFVLRTAGNLIPPYRSAPSGEAATVDYAIRALKVRHIVVCSHSNCGAMAHLMKGQGGNTPVDDWLEQAASVRVSALTHYPDARGADLAEAAGYLNALAQLENLRTWPEVRNAEVSGEVQLHAWMYQIPTGSILAFDKDKGGFVPLEEAGTEQPLLEDLSTWSAVLNNVGSRTDAVCDAIVKITSWPRREVMQLLASTPLQLLTGLSHIEAEVVETWLTEAGASVDIRRE